jgi:hypothetical protein
VFIAEASKDASDASGIFDTYSPLPQRISLSDEPAFERAARPGQEVLPAPKTNWEIRSLTDHAGFADGSVVVECRDLTLNVVILMRQFPSGEMIPLESRS